MVFDDDSSKTVNVDGEKNLTAGGDININTIHLPNENTPNFEDFFSRADQLFKANVIESGVITRGKEKFLYSSKELFSSLMHIGIPFNAAILIPIQVPNVLATILAESTKEVTEVTTSHIRYAVAHCIGGLCYSNNVDGEHKYTEEQVYMWSAAYVRRYGSPDNQLIRVLDHENEKELNYSYVQRVLIPHLFQRIIGGDLCGDPSYDFPEVFNSSRMKMMSNEIIRFANTLNLYTLRYKTLFNLLHDIILEPPHPWFVSEETMDAARDYNIERALHHLQVTHGEKSVTSDAIFIQCARECAMHSCAALLSHYGAFLGVGTRYGLLELIRMLKIKRKTPALWEYCRIKEVDIDLNASGAENSHSLQQRLSRFHIRLNGFREGGSRVEINKTNLQLLRLYSSLFPKIGANIKLIDVIKLLEKNQEY